MSDETGDIPPPKVYYLFGQDITTIPGLRTSVLAGCASTIASMLLTFLCTSSGPKTIKAAGWTFVCVTFPYWFYLQNKWYKDATLLEEARQAIKRRTGEDYMILESLENYESQPWG